jgi:hypothetical protein
MERISAITRTTFARVIADKKFGTAIAAKIPIMATTISNSIKVNASFLVFIMVLAPISRVHAAVAISISCTIRLLYTKIRDDERQGGVFAAMI